MGKVIEITEAQALQIKGKEYTKDMYFNPIQDAKGKWVISTEEALQYKKSEYIFIKALPEKDYEAKPSLNIFGTDEKPIK